MVKVLKLKIIILWELISMFVKITEEELVGLKYNNKVKIQSILEFGDHTGNTHF